MKKVIAVIALIGCAAVLAGCGTMRGFGQDVSGSGQSIQNAAS